MVFSYYPGCTLKNQAKDLDVYARKSAVALGIELKEINEWQCCGGVYTSSPDDIAHRLSSVRALANAKEQGGTLITICSACHNVIKRVNDDMVNNADINMRANNYMQLEQKYNGETKVLHYLEMLRDVVGFDNIKKAVKNPINKKIGAYYGCLLLRPNSVLAFDNPENPSIIENFIKAIGATPVVYAMRNECCGAYVSVTHKEIAEKKSANVINSAKDAGAEMLVTACPLCMYNLTENGKGAMEVKYFTELLAEALGVKE